jgi:hypothetical protein
MTRRFARPFSNTIVTAILVFAITSARAASDDSFAQVLTSSQQNVRLDEWHCSSHDITPTCPTNWSVHKFTLHGGKQEGVDVIEIDNGRLQLAVCPTRGMGLLWGRVGDVRLGWDSPVKEIVHPMYVNLPSKGGLGWLEGFNEFVARCGLEWSGHPGTDKFINNVGDEATMDLTLHGRVENLPASEVEVVCERQSPYRIHVRGRVDERAFYGPKLELWTDLSTEPGSASFRIADTITNHGAADQEFQILYHSNFGPPLLGEGSTFVAAIDRITPFNAHAAEGIGSHEKYAGPTLGFVEQVYDILPAADASGNTTAMLVNPTGDRAASLSFNVHELPCLTQWKNTTAQAEGYVTGIEPGTSFPHNRRIEREKGRVPKLAAGASRSFGIEYSVYLTQPEVQAARDRIAAIQADRKPQVDIEPEKAE